MKWVNANVELGKKISFLITPQNGQTHANNSSAIADELFGCV